MRFSALLPGLEPAADNTPQRAMNRVIDRTLIDQQRALQPGVAVVSQKDVDQAIDTMRKQISAATNTDCETDAGWKAYLAQHGFTPDEIQDRMKERLEILKFIDVRFGVVVQVSNADVRNYYDQVLTPELEQNKQPLPDFRTVAPKIRQILRQRQVSNLIDEWLKSLRAEDHVQILDPAYAEAGNQGESIDPGRRPMTEDASTIKRRSRWRWVAYTVAVAVLLVGVDWVAGLVCVDAGIHGPCASGRDRCAGTCDRRPGGDGIVSLERSPFHN